MKQEINIDYTVKAYGSTVIVHIISCNNYLDVVRYLSDYFMLEYISKDRTCVVFECIYTEDGSVGVERVNSLMRDLIKVI